MLGEDEDWLHELSIDMFPEDGCLRVYGIECQKQIIANERAAGRAPTPSQPT
jgi:hypothetical protein